MLLLIVIAVGVLLVLVSPFSADCGVAVLRLDVRMPHDGPLHALGFLVLARGELRLYVWVCLYRSQSSFGIINSSSMIFANHFLKTARYLSSFVLSM